MFTIVNQPITRYASYEAAAAIAQANSNDDPDWTYTVVASGDRWVILVKDEEGIGLGCL